MSPARSLAAFLVLTLSTAAASAQVATASGPTRPTLGTIVRLALFNLAAGLLLGWEFL